MAQSSKPEVNEEEAAVMAELLRNGKQPSEIAEIVVNAIRDGVFYILPHPAWDDHLRDTFDQILSRERLPAATPPFVVQRDDGEKY